MRPGSCICNVLWLITWGWFECLIWCFFGLLWCCTVIGIPFGVQCFKIGCFILWPFGREILEKEGGADGCDCLLNIVWFFFGGFIVCILSFFGALICFLSICGIPCGLQLIKMTQLSLTPFGRRIVDSEYNAQGQPIIVVQPNIIVTNQQTPQQLQYAPPTQPLYPTQQQYI